MGCAASAPSDTPYTVDPFLGALRIGDRVEVCDARALHFNERCWEQNVRRCGAGWAPGLRGADFAEHAVWYAPCRLGGYWWPATVVNTSSTRGIKVHYAGYGSQWDDWVKDSSHRVRLACAPDDLAVAPAVNVEVEVQLIQLSTCWAPGKVTGLAADGRVIVELEVETRSRYYEPARFHQLHVPLRVLRLAGAPTAGAAAAALSSSSSSTSVAASSNPVASSAAAVQNGGGATNELPAAIIVKDAGVTFVNGVYHRDGTYGSVPLFKNGQVWLLRYRMPSGAHFWYLADKDRLEVDDGDYYRVRADAASMRLPPLGGIDSTHQWGAAKDGRGTAIPTFEYLYPSSEVAEALPVPSHFDATDLNRYDLANIVIGEYVLPEDVSNNATYANVLDNTTSNNPQPPGLQRQSSGAAANPPRLIEIVAILRYELGLLEAEHPTIDDVVRSASASLGVEASTTGQTTTVERAVACWRVLGSPPPLGAEARA